VRRGASEPEVVVALTHVICHHAGQQKLILRSPCGLNSSSQMRWLKQSTIEVDGIVVRRDFRQPFEPTARAFAGVLLGVNDMFDSHVMSCRRAALEPHLDSPLAPRGQCVPLGRSSSGEPEQTAFDQGELPIR
jgi:hypothetical protein